MPARLRIGLLLSVLVTSTLASALDLSPQEQAGKRLYREGLSSSDAQVSARVGAADMLVPASVVPCASCHGNDGLGRAEGGVRPPSLNWQRLAGGQGARQVNGRRYPAYSEGLVARAIQEGRDPAGNRLDPAMPRFVLSMADQRNLTAYLKRLADDRDPGLEEQTLRLGTLLPTRGALAEPARVVAAVLNDRLAQINRQGGIHGRTLQLVNLDPGPDQASAEQALGQLIDQERVFALVAPMAPALDASLIARLEQARLPLIGAAPQLASSRQVFDPLPGLREQLLSLADYAQGSLSLQQAQVSIVYADASFAALAATLRQALLERGWSNVSVAPFEQQAAPGQALFYLGKAAGFSRLTEALQQAGRTPYLFAASSQVASELLLVPQDWSRRVFLAYPFIPSDWTPQGRDALTAMRQRQGLDGRQGLLQVSTWCAMQLLEEALKRAGRDASREKLTLALEGLHDVQTGLTPALGYGPGRRQGLNGAHVVTVEMPGPVFYPVAAYQSVVETRSP
ncbi:ABC transporter substrate-binding protein [Pseudomonas rubra]|uniref:ABC transporter substrate-binding protein n=1 Tax=Pseudomonas rubra TaxID=2942627 RepID=A0ABT5P318_9PSED|nr:ABC transporter substrate-binding protein [Pseudomonas rubra]MDD1012669.1 ABC transporter substrate-binding protein [Pseudomonas rubra]MDD1037768.1 ABC transporter substrate-binding protein [Pseudomonas rubra]MDD1157790.1 ABC transporter substrate-binding protein [Pseudomonas rubra]